MIQPGTVQEMPYNENDGMASTTVFFMCKFCHNDQAMCFICHKYGPIEQDDAQE